MLSKLIVDLTLFISFTKSLFIFSSGEESLKKTSYPFDFNSLAAATPLLAAPITENDLYLISFPVNFVTYCGNVAPMFKPIP